MNVKKIISVLLAMLIVTTSFSLLPVSASALETEETKETVITESGTTVDSTFAAEIDSGSVELCAINLPDDEDAPNYPEIIKFENTNNGVMVYWTAFPGAESYRLFYWNGEKWRSVGSTSELSYLHKNVENGKSYLYIVRAVDEWGDYCSDFNHDGYENVYLVKENTENELVKKSGTTGDCTWELDEDGTLTISGDGDMEDYSINDYESWGDTIKTVIINAGVTNIGNLAFANCTSLTSITIPDSVTSIGNDAFSECESLTNIVIPDSVTSIGDRAFDSCRSLTSITIPNSVASIGYSAFSFCESLTSITLPDSVTSICESAFCFCRSLMSITIPNSVTKIGESAFYFCRNLTSITIPSSVTSIGDDAFGWCTSLTSIAIPNSVTSIGASAFCECISLKSIEIPKKVTSIGDQMFYGCINLESLTIPSNVTSIGESAFCRCTSLNSITIPSSVKSIGEHAFGFFYNFNLNTHHGEYTKIEDFVIIGKSGSEAQSFAKENGFIFEEDTENELVKKSGITGDCTWTLDDKGTLTISGNGAMGDYMYDNNTESEHIINLDYQAMFKCYGLNYWDFPLPTESGLSGDDLIFYDSLVNIASPINRTPWGTEIKSVIINDGVKSIGACAFLGCTELTKVSIPDSVNNIGDFAFFDCEKLASVTISENMERIGQKAFAFSRQLRSITIPKNVKDIGLSPFEGCANLTNITVDKDNSYYDSRNDCNAIISKKNSALLSGCKSTIIPEGVMNIYPNAFFGMLYDTTYFYNVELKTINIPDSVENIGSNAFAFCNQLERVSIPSNVYIVNNKAFLNCTHLDYIDIANSRRDMEIGMEAFFGCNFSQITIPPRVNKIGEYAFGYSDAFGKNYYKIDNFAIKGKSGSEAQRYAEENGFIFIPTVFEWGKDNWRFDNKPEYFNDIKNDNTIIQKIANKFELSEKQKSDLNAWFTNKYYMGTGMCFGMTVSEILARKGILKLSEYKLNDIINYNDINSSNTRLVISVIQGIFNTTYGDNYLQNLKLSTFNPVDYKQSDFLRNIETKLTDSNNLVMIGYKYKEGYKDSEKNNYHAVLGYGIEEGDYTIAEKNVVKKYNRRILIADPDYLSQNELKDEACIYYNSDYTSWVCPIRSYYWNDNSDSNAEIYDVLIDADSKDSPVGSGEGESENHYIAGISIYNKSGKQQTIEQVEGTGDPELNFTGDGSGIARYYIDGGNRAELYALWNPTADYIVKYSTPSDYNMKMDYEHVTYYANVENGKSTLVKPEGYINIKGSDANYSITMLTDDSERVTDWYALTVSGNNTDEVTLKKHENGYILSSENLQNIEIKAEKGDVEAVKTFSTTYNSVFIYEIDENTIGIKVDVDGDGTYETELSDVQNTYQIGDVNLDGVVNVNDVTAIQYHLAELEPLKDNQLAFADVDGNGAFDINDATKLQKYLAGLTG